MGTVGFGLAQIGAGLQQAKDQIRKDQIERQYADIAQQYARTNAQRAKQEQADFEERMRVARLPKFIGFRSVGGRLYYGLQNPDGTVKTNEVTGITSAEDAQALETAVQALPADAQAAARAAIVPYIEAGDYPGARGALKPIMTKNAEANLPQPTTTTVTSGTGRVLVDVPGEPGKYMYQDAPISSTRTTYKGKGAPPTIIPPAKPSVPLVRTPTSQMPKTGKLKPEMEAGLRNLHVALWGSPDMPGLDKSLKVLDEPDSRKRIMLAAGVGAVPDPKEGVFSKMVRQQMYTMLTDDEKQFDYQLRRAIGDINVLRSIAGLPRSTQQLTEQYASELPNLVRSPNSKDGMYQMQLIERQIKAAMDQAIKLGPEAATPGIEQPITSGSTDQPNAPQAGPTGPRDIDTVLDQVFGPRNKPQ